jgi:hypothetical protein
VIREPLEARSVRVHEGGIYVAWYKAASWLLLVRGTFADAACEIMCFPLAALASELTLALGPGSMANRRFDFGGLIRLWTCVLKS